MATTISGTSVTTTTVTASTVNAADIVDSGPLSVGPQGITFADASVQTTAYGSTLPALNVYTSPGTWTKPAAVKWIKVTVVGGGGNGGTSPGTGAATGGAGGGASINTYPAPSLPGPQPYTVGSAGATSSFGVAPVTVISATGGGNGSAVGYGVGGVGSNGQLNAQGSAGAGFSSTTIGGSGGSSILGGGGRGASPGPTNAAGAGGAYGGGGGGGGTTNPAGGAGATGVVIVEEFY